MEVIVCDSRGVQAPNGCGGSGGAGDWTLAFSHVTDCVRGGTYKIGMGVLDHGQKRARQTRSARNRRFVQVGVAVAACAWSETLPGRQSKRIADGLTAARASLWRLNQH